MIETDSDFESRSFLFVIYDLKFPACPGWEVGMKRAFALIFMGIVFFGCTSAVKMNDVRLGMTTAEVIDVLGKPNSTSAMDDIVFLKYRLYNKSVVSDDFYVKLKGGKVEAYGQVGDFGQGY